MSPDPVWPGLFLPCSLPRLLPAAAGGGLAPSPARRSRGATPHRLPSYAKEASVAPSFTHGALRSEALIRVDLSRRTDSAADLAEVRAGDQGLRNTKSRMVEDVKS